MAVISRLHSVTLEMTIVGENDKGSGLLLTPLSNKVCVVWYV